MKMDRVDLHMHSVYSDGTDDEYALTQKIKDTGIRTVSLTDHDTIEGCDKIAPLIPPDVKFIYGIEFSCINEIAKCHILGYGFDPENEAILSAIEKGRAFRRQLLSERLEYLHLHFGIEFTDEERRYLYSQKNVGKPHIATLLMKRGLCQTVAQGVKKYFSLMPKSSKKVSAKEATEAIISAGGIPVWAHPLGGEGDPHIDEAEFSRRLALMLTYGIRGLECYYSRYSKAQTDMLTAYAGRYGLLISGGSDYHGKNKDIELCTLNSYGKDIGDDDLNILDVL